MSRSHDREPALQRAGFFLLALALCVPAGSVFASGPGLSWQGSREPAARAATAPSVSASGDYLARMDRDGDGRVSLVEYQGWLGYAFERMDRDGDGILSPAELPGGRGRPVRLDEHRASLAAAFRRQDRNGDGMLDARELAAPPR